MKILLLGAHGMLGKAVQNAFQNEELLLWDLAECDIAKPETTAAVIAAAPDLIINTAATTAVDACETAEAAANAVNGIGVKHLALAAQSLGIPMVHFSTDYVFDGNNKEGYPEDAPVHPINAYGRSKALGERFLFECAPQSYLIRTSYLFGRGGKNIVETFLMLGKTKHELAILVDQYSKATFAKDLAEATAALLAEKAPWGMYHLTNEGVFNWMEFVTALFEIADLHPKVRPVPMSHFIRPAARPQYSALQNTKRPLLRPWGEALAAYLASRPSVAESE